jgi:membrane-bound acyltransferase YfiQ involved in biofilm formation
VWIDKVPGVNTVLAFIGKHSMNIFLAHNFVRIVWYYDFTYSFKSWWLITLVLLAISIVLSICIEALKKLLRYDKLLLRLRSGCDALGASAAS